MVPHDENGAPSRRFVRAYLIGWGVLAMAALGYLMTLALQPDQLAVNQRPKIAAEPDAATRATSKVLAEVGTIRQTIDNLQKDVSELKESVDQRSTQEKATQSRLTVLEEKVAAWPEPTTTVISSSATTPTTVAKPKVAEKAAEHKAAEKAAPKVLTAKAAPPKQARVITVEEGNTATSSGAAGSRLETGSIAAGVSFGEPVVTRAGQVFAVQLDAAPSIDVLRLRWSLLLEQHGAALGPLQPRFVAPRNPGGPYRLVAGPLLSAADAKAVCAALTAQSPACSTTEFVGEPL
jgi:hypothetical protein